jgi:hypothetical protein
MNDYFGNAEQTEQINNAPQTATTVVAAPTADEDEDMIL